MSCSVGSRSHHRSRLLNAKKISTKSATEIAEVLGISSSSAPTPSGATTPLESGGPTTVANDNITTSSTSISDYFSQKLEKLEGMHKRPQGKPQTEDTACYSEDESHRFGLGLKRISLSSLSTSNAHGTGFALGTHSPAVDADAEPSNSTSNAVSQIGSSSSSSKLSHTAPPADSQTNFSETARKKVKKKDKHAKRERKGKNSKEINEKVEVAEAEGGKDRHPSLVMESNDSGGSRQKRKCDGEGKEDDDEERRIRKERKKEKKRRKLE